MSYHLKKLTNAQLMHKAYLEEDDEIYMSYIHELRKRGNHKVFNLAKEYAYSKEPVKRDISASVLSQIGYKSGAFKGESIHLLSKLLNDKNVEVLSSAIYAFGFRKCTRYAKKLASFITLNSKEVNEALAFSLGGYEDHDAVDALILLMKNKDFDIRNWATFSLAQITEMNSQKIRDALFENVNDEKEIRGEAMLGLARKKDKRVIDVIINDLQSEFYGSWIFEAIREMPDKKYIQYLDKFIESLDDEDKKAFKNDIKEAKEALRGLS